MHQVVNVYGLIFLYTYGKTPALITCKYKLCCHSVIGCMFLYGTILTSSVHYWMPGEVMGKDDNKYVSIDGSHFSIL